jgi:hypothetical protein
MSRTFVRRLAAVALLAVLCFALPAAAAAPRHTAKAPATAPSLWDEILSWIGNFLGGPSPAGAEGRAKVTTTTSSSSVLPTDGLANATSEANIGVDPNGHS